MKRFNSLGLINRRLPTFRTQSPNFSQRKKVVREPIPSWRKCDSGSGISPLANGFNGVSWCMGGIVPERLAPAPLYTFSRLFFLDFLPNALTHLALF
jgi:hypothetical protein